MELALVRTVAAWVLCTAGAAFLMHFELHTDDAGVEAGFVFGLALILGAVHPARPWLWALIVGLSIPISDLLFGVSPQQVARLLAIGAVTSAVALAGSYLGAFAARALASGRQPT